MKKKILDLGTVLSKEELKQIKGGTVANYCFDNPPGYRAECRELALSNKGSGNSLWLPSLQPRYIYL